jgi:hypothetical protein
MIKICNWGSKSSVTQTPLIGYFVLHAKGSSIGPFFLRREPSYPFWWNVARINKTDILQYNGAFLEMLGLERFPDQSTLRRFLRRLPPKSIRQLVRLHDSLRAYLFALPYQRNSLVFDVDSTVLIIYGRAEGACGGIQPQEAGSQVLPSLAVLRGTFPGVLAWELAPRQRWCIDRCRALPQSLSGQGPFDDRPLAHGLGLLRQPCYSLPGRLGMRVRDGGAGEYRNIKARARACRFQALGNGWQVAEFGRRCNAT